MKLAPVYLVIGCPGSGKSWVCDQLTDDFTYVHHDLFVGMAGSLYVANLIKAAAESDKPVLGEAPFSVSQIKDPLESFGIQVTPVFIIEKPEVIALRYYLREQKSIPKGHLTRQETYERRSKNYQAFAGSSSQVLQHLQEISKRSTTTKGNEDANLKRG